MNSLSDFLGRRHYLNIVLVRKAIEAAKDPTLDPEACRLTVGQKVFCVLGLPGSGKTSLTDLLQSELACYVVSLDAIRLYLSTHRIVASPVDIALQVLSEALKAGYNVVIDGVSAEGGTFSHIRDRATSVGADVVYLRVERTDRKREQIVDGIPGLTIRNAGTTSALTLELVQKMFTLLEVDGATERLRQAGKNAWQSGFAGRKKK